MRSWLTITTPRRATSLGKTAWQGFALLIALVIMFAMMRLAHGGEPQQLKATPGLIELRIDELPAGADITWEARQPLSLPFRTYENGAVIVFHTADSGVKPGGQIVVTSDVIDWEGRKRDKTSYIITIEGPTPPPDPKPDDPKPDEPKPPQPSPAPIPEPGLRVGILFETRTASQMPRSQLAILNDDDVRTTMTNLCVKAPGQIPWVITDPDAVSSSFDPLWKRAFERPRGQLPWVIISNGTTGFEGPLPETKADFLALLRKYGGQQP